MPSNYEASLAGSERLANMVFQNTDVGFFFLNLLTNELEYSPAYAAIMCGDAQAKLKRLDLIKHLHPEDELLRQIVFEEGLRTGKYEYRPRTIWKDGSVHQTRVWGVFHYDESGKAVSIFGNIMLTSDDPSNRLLQTAENRFRAMVQQAPVAMLVLRGEDLIFDVANEAMLQLLGQNGVIIGKSLLTSIPELKDQPIGQALKQAYISGEPFYEDEILVSLTKNGESSEGYFSFSYIPLKEFNKTIGVLLVAVDVTTQVTARNKMEESEHVFRSLIEEAPVATCLFVGEKMMVKVANEKMLGLWGKGKEIMGQPLVMAVPELVGQPFLKILDDIFKTGKTYHARDAAADLIVNGVLSTYYFDFTYQPLLNANGEVYAIMDMAIDVTEQVVARKKLEESELFARSILENSPVAKIVFTGEDMILNVVNEKMLELLGKDASIIGQPFMEAMPELRSTPLMDRLRKVLHTGETFYSAEEKFTINRFGQPYTGYYNYACKALLNLNGAIYGIINTSSEVTEQVLARHKVEESEARFRSLIQAAPIAIGIFVGRSLIIEEPNQTFIDIIGKGRGIVGKPLAEAMPELEGQPFLQILDDVFTSGKTFQTFGTQVNIMHNGVMKAGFYDFSYTPLFDKNGEVYAILDIAEEVTDRVMTQQRIEESRSQLLASFEQSPVAVATISEEGLTFRMANTFYGQLVGREPAQLVGKPLLEALPELQGQGFDLLLKEVIATGKAYIANEAKANIFRNQQLETIYVNLTYQPQQESDGSISGVLVVATDVTSQVVARQQIIEAEEALRGAIELAELGTWSIDLNTRLLTYSDRLNSWFGFENKGPISIDEAYAGIAESDWPLVKTAMTHALTPGTDGIYNVEYRIIDRTNGRERIIHAQGKAILNEQGVPVKVNGTAQDVTAQRVIQLALEQQVQERTEELAASNEELLTANEELANANNQLLRSNEELAQYAYVASHDLQEPLRKIRIFSGLLAEKTDLSDKNTRLVDKINQSSERMTMLIEDLLEFSRLLNSDDLVREVDLQSIVRSVVSDFELAITEKGATVEIGQLPVIEAVGLQMNQLFYNLLSNALKFVHPDRPPLIKITAEIIEHHEVRQYIPLPERQAQYYHIAFSDNGIGFDDQYSEHIFEVFKRLHGREIYPGTGIGLALCRRIVANQRGHLFATSVPGEGTTFHVILPDR